MTLAIRSYQGNKTANTNIRDYQNDVNYIHYRAEDDPSLSNLDFLSQSKLDIMINSRDSWNRMLNTRAAQYSGKLNNIEKADILALLRGELFQGADFSGTQVPTETTGLEGTFDIKTILSKKSEYMNKIKTIADVVSLMNNYLDHNLNQDEKSLRLNYVTSVFAEYLNNHDRKVAYGAMQNNLDMSIINSVLGRFNNTFIRFPLGSANSSFNAISTAHKKMMMLVESLPYFAEGQSVTVRHKGQAQGKSVNTESQLVHEILLKFFNWLEGIEKDGAEYALLVAMESGIKKTAKEFKKADDQIKVTVNMTGGHGDISIDGRVVSSDLDTLMREAIGSGAGRGLSRGVGKSDVTVTVGTDSVTINVGMSNKQYKNLSFMETPKGLIAMGSIKIQDGTPLLTLLYREAGLRANQIFDVVKLAVTNDDSGALDNTWNNLIETVTYRAFLNALTGRLASLDTSYFFVANHQIFSIGQLLNGVINSMRGNGGNFSLRMNESVAQDNVATGGLIRSSYTKFNKYLPQEDAPKNIALAVQRSNQARISSLQLLYSTKIRINMNLGSILLGGAIGSY